MTAFCSIEKFVLQTNAPLPVCHYIIIKTLDVSERMMDPRRKAIAAAGGIMTIAAVSTSVLAAYGSLFDKSRQHDSVLSGQDWMEELLRSHDGRFYNKMRSENSMTRVVLHTSMHASQTSGDAETMLRSSSHPKPDKSRSFLTMSNSPFS